DFKEIIDQKLFPRIKFIIDLGNKAAHTPKPVTRDQAVESLRNLFDFISWIDFSYSEDINEKPFNSSIVPDGQYYEQKTRKIQEELAKKQEEWRKKQKELEDQLESEKERNLNSNLRKENSESRSFVCDDISEFKTRKLYIDLALESCGWEVGNDCIEEVELSGMPGASGKGYADYVLYSDNGKPMAVVEAKRTSNDPKKGKVQAKLYADCLEKEYNTRPLIFFTNGFETWFWDDNEYPERLVSGFFTKDELDWHLYSQKHKKDISKVNINQNITDRPYQQKAVQAVCDTFQSGQRKALLVMATGSGKTRTAVSITDVLLKNGWIKNILFLADRRELVKQAKKSFSNLLPSLSICNLLDKADDPKSRMVFSTYPTIMNAIDDKTDNSGLKLFTPGHFDLIIVDESHRSIYKKYQDIFKYFDGHLLGLTATPKNDIDKNTYSIFNIENDVPTFAYELEEAVNEGFLVPYTTIETKMKFIEDGIHYDELSDEEKETWEDTFDDDVKDVSGEALNSFLFNDDTIDKVISDLMEKGIKVEGGDKIGKTIIFAKNTKHAEFIIQRFNRLYPSYAGKTAATIYNGIKYVDSLIEDFSQKNKPPHIAISVDMLDTGIDIPEVVNLVFFKKIRSKAKFWQMIGRGTRLCKDLFGPYDDKKNFLIFDYCSNFEFFRINKNGVEGVSVKSLSENIFNIKVKIARELEHSDFQNEHYKSFRDELVQSFVKEINRLDENLFSNKMRIKYIHRYKNIEKWNSISEKMVKELEDEIAPVLIPSEDPESAKRFDLLMYTLELFYLQGISIYKQRSKLVSTAEKLETKGNLPQIRKNRKLISDIQTPEFFENADIKEYEEVRKRLRDLVALLETEEAQIYFTSFEDEILEVVENQTEFNTSEFQNYRKKVDHYLKNHKDDIAVYKLKNNKPITDSEIKHLEKILLHDLGTRKDYEKEFGNQPLVKLVAGLVGLEREAANKVFAEFLNDNSLNSNQMEFVNLVVDYIVKNGRMDKKVLNDHPFNKFGSISYLFEDKKSIVKSLVKKIDEINQRVENQAL
ncbi:MAG: DEAD/DEAH box helicase family protein, partial [Thermotogota bacterium]